MIYKVKNGNQQHIKQPITTANERVTRASAVISRRPNCCWTSSLANDVWEKLSDRRCFRRNFEYEQLKNDRWGSDVFSLVRLAELKQHGINEHFVDGSRIYFDDSWFFSIWSKTISYFQDKKKV